AGPDRVGTIVHAGQLVGEAARQAVAADLLRLRPSHGIAVVVARHEAVVVDGVDPVGAEEVDGTVLPVGGLVQVVADDGPEAVDRGGPPLAVERLDLSVPPADGVADAVDGLGSAGDLAAIVDPARA